MAHRWRRSPADILFANRSGVRFFPLTPLNRFGTSFARRTTTYRPRRQVVRQRSATPPSAVRICSGPPILTLLFFRRVFYFRIYNPKEGARISTGKTMRLATKAPSTSRESKRLRLGFLVLLAAWWPIPFVCVIGAFIFPFRSSCRRPNSFRRGRIAHQHRTAQFSHKPLQRFQRSKLIQILF